MAPQPNSPTHFARNLQRLMDEQGLSQAQLASRCGVSQRTLSTLLNLERPLEINPTLRTILMLADYFNLPTWMLMAPGMPANPAESRLDQLLSNFAAASVEGRDAILRLAEREAAYAARAPAEE